jgi:serine protease Do
MAIDKKYEPPKLKMNPLVLVFFCFVASFLGSYVFVNSGLVRTSADDSIVQNREKIVLQEGEIVADVAKKVSPSVVSIVTETQARGFFGIESQSGAGTGIIISKDGYVLTNKHVIPAGTDSVQVIGSDGTTYDNVTLVGRDPLNDIAFLKIQDVNNLTPATLGDSGTAIVGQKVVAIGNALGQFQNTVTSGIISGIGRPIETSDEIGASVERLENLLQTDAAINPGNSGGPLVNLKGEVVGINTAVAQQAEGIGFAIPINATKGMIKGVLENGKAERAYLGVRYTDLTPEIVKSQNLPVKEGAYVYAGENENAVSSGSPAADAGIQNKDIIVKVDNTQVTHNNSLSVILGQHQPGDTVTLTINRGGKEQTIKATLDTAPSF